MGWLKDFLMGLIAHKIKDIKITIALLVVLLVLAGIVALFELTM
jgi:hypothetical protein